MLVSWMWAKNWPLLQWGSQEGSEAARAAWSSTSGNEQSCLGLLRVLWGVCQRCSKHHGQQATHNLAVCAWPRMPATWAFICKALHCPTWIRHSGVNVQVCDPGAQGGQYTDPREICQRVGEEELGHSGVPGGLNSRQCA